VKAEEEVFAAMGTLDVVAARARWIDAQIDKEKVKTLMMRKVAESAVTWAFIAFLGFIVVSATSYTIDYIKEHIQK
jgi:hypothetical protein